MQPKKCKNYHLSKDNNETHIVSGIDGSLMEVREDDVRLYQNEEFCVDYVYFKSVDMVKVVSVTLEVSSIDYED